MIKTASKYKNPSSPSFFFLFFSISPFVFLPTASFLAPLSYSSPSLRLLFFFFYPPLPLLFGFFSIKSPPLPLRHEKVGVWGTLCPPLFILFYFIFYFIFFNDFSFFSFFLFFYFLFFLISFKLKNNKIIK